MPTVQTKIRVTKTGNGDLFIRSMEESFRKLDISKSLETVKNHVLDSVDNYITGHRKRVESVHKDDEWRTTAKRNLINTLRASTQIVQVGTNKYKLGIGNIKFLRKHAPYWAIVNYGGKINMRGKEFVPGYFTPGQSYGRQSFKYTGRLKGTNPYNRIKSGFYKGEPGYSYRMVPVNPIPPMRYLNNMAQTFDSSMKYLAETYKKVLRNRR